MKKITDADHMQDMYVTLPTDVKDVSTDVPVHLDKKEPLNFISLYKGLPSLKRAPKSAFIEMIAELCLVSPQSVRMWVQGVQRPDALKQKLISEKLGIDAETLFPPKK